MFLRGAGIYGYYTIYLKEVHDSENVKDPCGNGIQYTLAMLYTRIVWKKTLKYILIRSLNLDVFKNFFSH